MWTSSKKIAISIVIVLLAIAGGIIYYSGGVMGGVPSSFTEAREAAARVSQDIVTLTSKTNATIQNINAAESTGSADRIPGLIDEARATNKQAYEKAFELSKDLQQMTEALNRVGSRESQQLAYEAVAIELSLTSEFITYTGALNDFLNTLAKTAATGIYGNRQALAQELATVNGKAAIINNLNREFNEKMKAFDASL